MKRKIYKKQNKSRLKCDFKFSCRYWWLRSVINDCNCFSGCVNCYGYDDDGDVQLECCIAPVCAI